MSPTFVSDLFSDRSETVSDLFSARSETNGPPPKVIAKPEGQAPSEKLRVCKTLYQIFDLGALAQGQQLCRSARTFRTCLLDARALKLRVHITHGV